jgi:antitoxin component of MazEF toxin-antitoxin module
MSEETFCIDLGDRGNAASFAARVWRAGESLVVTVPKTYAERLRLREGDVVDVAIKVLKRVVRQ